MRSHLSLLCLATLFLFACAPVAVAQRSRGGDSGGGDSGGGRESDRGRDSGRDRGSDRGRGGRGGFDPSSFLSRMDRNGNGMIDPDEQQGGTSSFIGRLSAVDPSIKEGQAIPLKKITDAFEKLRQQRDSDGGSRGRSRGGDRDSDDAGDRDRGWQDRRAEAEADLLAELLVPGFGEEDLPPLLLGFGAAAEIMTTDYTEDDLREGNERIRQFDRDKSGFLEAKEISSRFGGNPMDFDVNRDGKLSAIELAVRQARRRVAEEDRKSNEKKVADDGGGNDSEPEDLFGGRKSYRAEVERSSPNGVPGFFIDKDANRDGQVSMVEYSDDWTDELMSKFIDYDFDGDGVITAAEALRSVEEGTASTVMTGRPSTNRAAMSTAETEVIPSNIDPKYLKYAGRIIERNDANGDGILVPSEIAKMLMDPSAADSNRDGKVTLGEYASYLQEKDRR